MANPAAAWWARLPRAQRLLLGVGVPGVGVAALVGRLRRPTPDAEPEPAPAPAGSFSAPGVGGFIAANELGAFSTAFTDALSAGIGGLQEQLDELKAKPRLVGPSKGTSGPIVVDPLKPICERYPSCDAPIPWSPPASVVAPVKPVRIPYSPPPVVKAPPPVVKTPYVPPAPAPSTPTRTTTTTPTRPARVVATSIGQGIIAATSPLKPKTFVVL